MVAGLVAIETMAVLIPMGKAAVVEQTSVLAKIVYMLG